MTGGGSRHLNVRVEHLIQAQLDIIGMKVMEDEDTIYITWNPIDLCFDRKFGHILGGSWSKIEVTQCSRYIYIYTICTYSCRSSITSSFKSVFDFPPSRPKGARFDRPNRSLRPSRCLQESSPRSQGPAQHRRSFQGRRRSSVSRGEASRWWCEWIWAEKEAKTNR